MAERSLTRDNFWRKLKISEEQYYLVIAEYCYLLEGMKAPPKELIKTRANLLLHNFLVDASLLIKPLTFKPSKLDLENCWDALITAENKYYQNRAEFDLFDENITNPSEFQIKEKIKSLSHIELRKSIFLGKKLTEREIECVDQASLGKSPKETAVKLGISEVVVKKYRGFIYQKFRCETMNEAIFFATRLGYLPIKNKQLLPHTSEFQEVENVAI